MRALRIIASMAPETGGPCHGIRYSIPHLEAEGWLTEVVCLDDPGASFIGKDPFPVHALGRGIGPLCFHPRLLSWLNAHLSEYDAIVVHGLWLWPSIATWIAWQRLRKRISRSTDTIASRPPSANSQLPAPKIPPYYVMPHGMLDPWFQQASRRKWKALRNRIYWTLIEHRVIRDATAVLFTCQRELELARTTFPHYEPKKEINVGYGVPDPPKHTEEMDRSFFRMCPNLACDQPNLLFLGRIHPKKGVDLLIRAYAEAYGVRSKARNEESGETRKPEIPGFRTGENPCSPHSPMTGYREAETSKPIPALVIAGPIDSDHSREMIRLAESILPGSVLYHTSASETALPLAIKPSPMNRPAIYFTGMLHGDAKWGAINRCEAFVLPSHQENFGISIVEAMSCGKPVIVSNKVNIFSEIISKGAGYSGPDDYEGILGLLKTWSNTPPDRRRRMSVAAKSCFNDHFRISRIAGAFAKALG